MFKTSLTIAVALMLSAPALGADAESAPTRFVAHGDLNLGSAAGVATLDRRIDNAIDVMCGTTASANFAYRSGIRRCRAAALASVGPNRDALIAAARDTRDALRVASR